MSENSTPTPDRTNEKGTEASFASFFGSNTPSFLDAIPPAQVVREKLGQNVREARILRQLIKLSEQAERERFNRQQSTARTTTPNK